MTGHVCEELGAYVLGALAETDAARVSAHLGACAACRAMHDEIARLPVLLDLLDGEDHGSEVAPPARIESAILAGAAAEQKLARAARRGRAARTARWRSRPALAAGCALAGAACAVAVMAVASRPDERGDEGAVRVALTSPRSSARAVAQFEDARSGTRVSLRVRGLAATSGGQVYEVWFVRPEGRVSAGTFTVDRSGAADVRLTSAARRMDYVRLGVTREPDGLDPARNGPNVLAAPLPPS